MQTEEKILLAIIIFLASSVFIGVPITAYLEGSAKAEYLLKTQGIDLPWHKALFIEQGNQTISLD